jgi:FkbM family methyltransferase
MTKQGIEFILNSIGLKLSRVPQRSVGGFTLERDLKVIVGKRSPICFDVGANEGQTIAMFERTFLEPVVFAFEPNTSLASILRQRYRERKNITVLDFGLGAHEEQRVFHNYDNSTLGSFLELEEHASRDLLRTTKLSDSVVAVRTVDSFLSEAGVTQLDILKCDTQGFDLEVLKGASTAMARGRVDVVQVELNFARIYHNQGPATKICELLHEHNFDLVDFYEKSRRHNRIQWCTAIFLKRG